MITASWYSQAGNDPYTHTIESFIGREFPIIAKKTTEDMMEAIVSEFFASKQYRIGPKPSPESEVKIRDVVRRAVEANRPIPILIASAAIKVPIGESMDVAELSALRVLNCLNDRIRAHYTPGTNIRIRMEDLTEYAISSDVPNIGCHVENYTREFKALVRVLDFAGFITPVPESSLADPKHFLELVDTYAAFFYDYLALQSSIASLKLSDAGWKGGVSPEMQSYLTERLAKLYPEKPIRARMVDMSRYFAAILARRNMDAMGNDKTFDGRLEISFAPALPDTPKVSTRVYYRTVPLNQSSFHAPYWNAKGHLRINENGDTRIALGSWTDTYTPGQLVITHVRNARTPVTLRADYHLES